MNPPSRSVLRATLFLAALLAAIYLVPAPARAIQMRWSTGATDLTVPQNMQAVLVVQADSTEGTLPDTWRLQWTADSLGVQFSAFDPSSACLVDTAKVDSIAGPQTPADSAANQITAYFCSSGSNNAAIAYFLADLPGGGHGKMRVVALDPNDTTRVLESNEVVFNGGVSGDYGPLILSTQTTHTSLTFQLTAVGSGLTQTQGLSLVGSDGSWQAPLQVTSVSDNRLMATAALAANVPACGLRVTGVSGGATEAPVSADPPPPLLDLTSSAGCVRRFEEILDPNDPYMIQPKDFAFVPGGWTAWGNWAFHLFYIRQNQRIAARSGVDFTEKNIGHAVSNNLIDWPDTLIDTTAIRTRRGRFDSLHVWAPSIVRRGVVYSMFYTGVDAAQVQRMGLATSTDLVHWTQTDSILEVNVQPGARRVTWADPTPTSGGPPYHGQAQLRDPFVMEYPSGSGHWLMYYVTISQQYSPQMVVGVSESNGDFTAWSSGYPLWQTAFPVPANTDTTVVESPHAFSRDDKWWLFYTVDGDSVWAESNTYGPADTASAGARWTTAQKVWTLVPPAQAAWFYYWHASEYLQISALNDIEYLAGYDDAQPGIIYGRMRPATAPYLFTIDCDSLTAGVRPDSGILAPRLLLLGARPARGRAAFRIELPAVARVHLAVYDVMGRRVRTLADGRMPAGATDLAWDGRDAAGGRVGSGVYFASMTTAGGRHTARVLLLR